MINFPVLWAYMKQFRTPKSLELFAEKLGVEPIALEMLECTWSQKDFAWAFPMKGKGGVITGIRLINEDGEKWFVPGSQEGSFSVLGPIDSDIQKVIGIIQFEYETKKQPTWQQS